MKAFITYKAARANANMNREQMAQALKVSATTIKNWENGKGNPDLNQVRRMSEICNIPLDFLRPNG